MAALGSDVLPSESRKSAQIVDHFLEYSRLYPPLRLLVDGRPRRKVVGHVAPRRACSHYPPQSVEDLAQVVLALGCILSHESQVRSHEVPFFV